MVVINYELMLVKFENFSLVLKHASSFTGIATEIFITLCKLSEMGELKLFVCVCIVKTVTDAGIQQASQIAQLLQAGAVYLTGELISSVASYVHGGPKMPL